MFVIRCIALLVLAAAPLCSQLASPAPSLLIVPVAGRPEISMSLGLAGHVIGWNENFVVAVATGEALLAVRAKGWAHTTVPDAGPGQLLFLVPYLQDAHLTGLRSLATVLHAKGGDALVCVAAQDMQGVIEFGRRGGHAGAVRILRDSLRAPPERDWYRHTGRGGGRFLVPNPDIQALVSQVVQGNLLATVTSLSSIFTRRSDQPGGLVAQNQLVASLQAIPGLTVTTHDFDSDADNVIAELPGTLNPSRVVIIGAHYDSYVSQGATAVAPGADDNASGTAALLEVARILSQHSFKYTIRFICFASEEFGLVGSGAYAQMMVNQGQDVLAMINTDMNAYRAPGDPVDMVFIANDTSPALNSFASQICSAYVPTLPSSVVSLSGGTSDHRSFNQRGIPSTFPFEDVPNDSPYIHSANDVVGTSANDFGLSAEITRLLVALTAEIAAPVVMQVSHAPLSDTADTQGPYRVVTQASSLAGSTVAGVVLIGTASGGPFSIPMVPGAGADDWIADIPGQPDGTVVSYSIEATDAQGRTARYPEFSFIGAPEASFRVTNVIHFFSDDLESGVGAWTHGQIATQDDWQLGTPQGQAGDPSSAFSGNSVWANDLGNSGWNGSYANNTHNWLRSPVINCTGRAGVHLRFKRWLGVEDGYYDQARILVNGTQIWTNPATPGGGSNHLLDSSWQDVDLDISALADNNSSVQIEWQMQSDGGLAFGGWNIDDVSLTVPGVPVFRTLVADRTYSSLALGTPVALTMELGPAAAGRTYLMLPGISGSSPGIPAGPFTIPLNYDLVSSYVQLNLLNAPVFTSFAGILDGSGTAMATMALPAGLSPSLVGTTFTVAGVTLGPLDATTTHVEILMVP